MSENILEEIKHYIDYFKNCENNENTDIGKEYFVGVVAGLEIVEFIIKEYSKNVIS